MNTMLCVIKGFQVHHYLSLLSSGIELFMAFHIILTLGVGFPAALPHCYALGHIPRWMIVMNITLGVYNTLCEWTNKSSAWDYCGRFITRSTGLMWHFSFFCNKASFLFIQMHSKYKFMASLMFNPGDHVLNDNHSKSRASRFYSCRNTMHPSRFYIVDIEAFGGC